jgi:pimeloyl-ACP methyl ester carboxylesterase
MSAPPSLRFESFDGQAIAYRTLGQGRPTLLIHGFLSDARQNWFATGLAAQIAALGRQVIAPDLRGHGESAAPGDLAAWPADVLARDQEALIDHLGLESYDLAGYSLGARIAVRLMVRGARPGKAVLGGMGDFGIMEAGPRAAMFEDGIRHGEAAADPRSGRRLQALMAERGLKAEAMLGVLAAFAPTTEADLQAIPVPTLAVIGADDHDNGSVQGLADLLPKGAYAIVPGDHAGAVRGPELAKAFTDFLGAS